MEVGCPCDFAERVRQIAARFEANEQGESPIVALIRSGQSESQRAIDALAVAADAIQARAMGLSPEVTAKFGAVASAATATESACAFKAADVGKVVSHCE